jgi:hypothetical protein
MANDDEPRSPEGEDPIIVPSQALVPDQLVESLVPDPSQSPTPTVSLTGLLGRSAKEGYWRLYFSSTLERYAEFKEEDVLHSMKVPRALPPFLGMEATRVWIRHDAEIEYTRTESRRVQAKALQGGLTARKPIDPPEGVFRAIDDVVYDDHLRLRGVLLSFDPMLDTIIVPSLRSLDPIIVPTAIPEPI